MKKILFLSLIFLIDACGTIYHAHHNHLALVKAENEIQPYNKNSTQRLHRFADSAGILSPYSYNARDSGLSSSPSSSMQSVIFHTLKIDTDAKEKEAKNNSLQSKNRIETNLPDGQDANEKGKLNQEALWSLLTAIMALAFLPLMIVSLVLLKSAKKKFIADPSLRGRGLVQAADVLVTIECILLVLYLALAIVVIITCGQPGADCP